MPLTLTRKVGETIVIGDTLVTITNVGLKRVRLVIDGPRSTPVLRGELAQRIVAEKKEKKNP